MQKKINQSDGFTLIEVLVSIIILSVFALILVQGIRMTLTAFNINKTKTQALAIANEEIELIKSMPYNDIVISDDFSNGGLQKQKLTENGFLIEFDVKSINNDNRIKQVIVSVIKEPMKKKLEVVTEIISPPLYDDRLADAETNNNEYPPPINLKIISDKNTGSGREIMLEWDDPLYSKYEINTYRVYNELTLIGSTTVQYYIDHPKSNKEYHYYVTIVYSDGTESSASNEAKTK